MISFKEFISINEGLWGQIPVQGRKPSDGRGGYSMSSNSGSQGGAGMSPMSPGKEPESQPKMMRKKMKKI